MDEGGDSMNIVSLNELATIQQGAIVSKIIAQTGSVILFALSKNESISAHTSSRDAFVLVLEGEIQFSIASEKKNLNALEGIEIPANELHALKAMQDSSMLLIQKGVLSNE